MAMVTNLIDQLRRDEGEVLHVYLDSLGIRTAGVGHNLEAHGIGLPVGSPITQQQSDFWLEQDAEAACDSLHNRLGWTDALDDIRRGALQNMCFNLGINRLLQFHHFLGYMESGDYDSASTEMLNSLWAKQVGPRAKRLSLQISSGEWQ
jgi:lysozyme